MTPNARKASLFPNAGRKRYHFASLDDRLAVLAARHTGATVREVEAALGISKSVVSRICGDASRKEKADALALYQLAYEDARNRRAARLLAAELDAMDLERNSPAVAAAMAHWRERHEVRRHEAEATRLGRFLRHPQSAAAE